MKVIREKKKLIVLISVIVVAILIGVGVAVNATGSSGGIAKSVTFSEDMDGAYVYFRAVDAAGNVGEWSEPQRLFIDTTSPIITAKETSVEVEEGKSNDLESYFNIDGNGSSDITSVTFVDKSNGNKVVENTSELAVGTHEIEATVEKANGAKATATVIIVIAVLGYTLTFMSNGSVYGTILAEDKLVRFPEQEPTMSNKLFTGWYYDEATSQQANVGDSVTQNINLYAGWRSYVLNPNNGETTVESFWSARGSIGSIGDEWNETKGNVSLWTYEDSSEIEMLTIDTETSNIQFYESSYLFATDNKYPSIYLTDAYTIAEFFYIENNNLKVMEISRTDMLGECSAVAITGNIGIKIHFKDGSIDNDIVSVHIKFAAECIAKGTLITLANGEKKAIEEITYEDELLVWDFDNAKFATAKPLWIMKVKTSPNYNLLKFDNGTELKTIHQHRIFNKDSGKFTYPMTDDTPIGTTTFTHDGTETKLISKEVIQEKVDYYNIITDYHINLFANGILTSCRLSNLYPIKDMKYIKDNRKLATKEEYPDIPEEYFKGLRIAEQPRDINRDGNVKFSDDLNGYVQNLINNAELREY